MFFFFHVQVTNHLLLFTTPQGTYLIRLKGLAAFFVGEYASNIINKRNKGIFL